MNGIEELLLSLADSLCAGEGDPGDGVVVAVSEVELEIPIESRIVGGGRLLASLPRGRMVTGYDPPVTTLSFTLEAA